MACFRNACAKHYTQLILSDWLAVLCSLDGWTANCRVMILNKKNSVSLSTQNNLQKVIIIITPLVRIQLGNKTLTLWVDSWNNRSTVSSHKPPNRQNSQNSEELNSGALLTYISSRTLNFKWLLHYKHHLGATFLAPPIPPTKCSAIRRRDTFWPGWLELTRPSNPVRK